MKQLRGISLDNKIEILGFGFSTPATPFEPILLFSLLALIWLSWSQSDRFVRSVFLVISITISLFAFKIWGANLKHFAVLFSAYALIGGFFGITRYVSLQKLKYILAGWLFVLIFGFWFLEIAKYTPFHKMHYINQPFRLYFSGYIAWGIFLLISGIVISFLPNKKRSFGVWIGVLWLFVILLEGSAGSKIGLRKYSANLYWGVGVDKANNYGKTPLYDAVKLQNIETVEKLLAQGADVNKPLVNYVGGPVTPFEAAIRSNNYDLFLLLVDHGADLLSENKDGSKPIHMATWHSVTDFRIIKYLLDNGAKINDRDKYDMQPIHLAMHKAYNNKTKEYIFNPDLVKFLIANGADIESKVKHHSPERKSTPLVLAASKANYEAVRVMVELGADLYAEDPYGRNALEFARYNKKALSANNNGTLSKSISGYNKIIEYLLPLMDNK